MNRAAGIVGGAILFAAGIVTAIATRPDTPPLPDCSAHAHLTNAAIQLSNDCLDRWTATVEAFHDTVTQSKSTPVKSAAKVRKNWDRYRRNLCRK